MHPYVVESKERINTIIALLIASSLVALALHKALSWLGCTIPWWFDSPSVLGVYALAYGAFDRSLWRKKLFRLIGLVRTVDLNGHWKGSLRSYGSEYAMERDILVTIKQTWTHIRVSLHADHSHSDSSIGALLEEGGGRTSLVYTYLNEPKPGALPTMHTHRGTVWLAVKENGTLLEGDYYTGRDRMTCGTMILRKDKS